MLQIRSFQMGAFEDAAWRRFEDEMMEHGRTFSPFLVETLSEEEHRAATRQAIVRARAHGFTRRGPIRTYVELMYLFGSDFETDPQHGWIAEALEPEERDEDLRAEALFEGAVAYQRDISGPEARHTFRALGRVRELAKRPDAFDGPDLDAALRRQLEEAFPERARYSGDEGVERLVGAGRAAARELDFPTPGGDALVVVLMFAFGHGCTADPLYPWIARTLEEPSIVSQAARCDRLRKKALTWLDHVLERAPEDS